MDLASAMEWLDGHINHESSSVGVAAGQLEGLSLDPMRELMSVLGDPQDTTPVIHITGTNGKGSVGAMISSLLQANGLTVGVYSSPHLERLNERISRNGLDIPDEELAEVLAGIAAIEPLLTQTPSWFEIVTAAAFRWFAESPVDVVVLEVGLLGRYDATNVANADVAVVTSIGGDHTDFAAGWQIKVATEKAGIICPGSPVVLGEIQPDLLEIFRAEGAEPVLVSGADFGLVDSRLAVGGRVVDTFGTRGAHDAVLLPVLGGFQADNAAIAIEAVETLLDTALAPDVVEEGFAQLLLPGRMEVAAHHPLVVLDGAHNPDALAAVAKSLDDDFAVIGSRVLVVGMLEGRNVDAAVEAIGAVRPDGIICTTVPGGRSMGAGELASRFDQAGFPSESVDDPEAAVATALRTAADEDLVLVCGSFRLVGPARRVVSILSVPDAEENPPEADSD